MAHRQENQTTRRPGPEAGFNLISLAVVLIIVGTLAGIGLKGMGPALRKSNESAMRTQLTANLEAIKGYAARNLALPLSADFASTIPYPQDFLGNSLRYVKDNTLTLLTSEALCKRNSTSLTVRQYHGAVLSRTIPDVAFALINIGENRFSQIATSNDDTTLPTTPLNVYDFNDAGKDSDPAAPVAGADEPFDDLMVWVTLAELKALTRCEAKGGDLQILNKTLPDVKLYTYESCSLRTDEASCTSCLDGTCAWLAGACDNAPGETAGCRVNGYWDVTILADGGITDSGNYRWCVANTNTTGTEGFTFANSLGLSPGTAPMATGCTTDPTTWSAGPSLRLYNTSITQTTPDAVWLSVQVIDYADEVNYNSRSQGFTLQLVTPSP